MAETELGLGTDLVGEALDELGEVEADPAQDLGHGAAVGDLQALHLLAQAGTCNKIMINKVNQWGRTGNVSKYTNGTKRPG